MFDSLVKQTYKRTGDFITLFSTRYSHNDINLINYTPLYQGLKHRIEIKERLYEIFINYGKFSEICAVWKSPFFKKYKLKDVLLFNLNYGLNFAYENQSNKILGLTPLWMENFWKDFGYVTDEKINYVVRYGPQKLETKIIYINDENTNLDILKLFKTNKKKIIYSDFEFKIIDLTKKGVNNTHVIIGAS